MILQHEMNSGTLTTTNNTERLKVSVHGAVQGVGFRPFVYRLATELRLMGWVSNTPQGVAIEVEGEKRSLDSFLVRLRCENPLHAHIYGMETSYLDPLLFKSFEIRHSTSDGDPETFILPDIATCPECLSDIFDPLNRRYQYPFTNCTHCGPRYTIIASMPYDRENTTMAHFTMCRECQDEYENPLDRRFHAQPNACPQCGPHLELWNEMGTVLEKYHSALLIAVEHIRSGKIVAAKGVGGFHLLVDARNEEAVTRLRLRKRREAKPLALMFPSLASAKMECDISGLEEQLLQSPSSPIVLLAKSRRSTVAASVAPNNPNLGVILPYSPLHHLLLRELDVPIVATSGNISDEPISIDEREALARMEGIADYYLVHNRPILRHVDDSVVRAMLGREQVLRRARGYAPLPVSVKRSMRPFCAVGPHQKNTIAFSRGRDVFISQHIGDLETSEALDAFRSVTGDLKNLLSIAPEAYVSDLHPDYASTQVASESGAKPVRIQHHHAHVASCMAENELEGRVLGVSWDGSGFGTDGTIWGGEFLLTTDSSFQRVATLRDFCLPGGEKSIKEPRRTALGLLYTVLGDDIFELKELASVAAFTDVELALLGRMMAKQINSPRTSSVGRLFDAVASITNVAQHVSFEGEAAMQLEYAIRGSKAQGFYRYRIDKSPVEGHLLTIDWSPMLVDIIRDSFAGENVSVISTLFHNTLSEIIVAVATLIEEERVVLTGGCFQNRYLTERTVHRLRDSGFTPYWHQRVPPNDGGISLGQIYAASKRKQSPDQDMNVMESAMNGKYEMTI